MEGQSVLGSVGEGTDELLPSWASLYRGGDPSKTEMKDYGRLSGGVWKD